jgi:hypothetical protein
MRKVVARLLMSLDGVVESPDKWEFDSFDDDVREGREEKRRDVGCE